MRSVFFGLVGGGLGGLAVWLLASRALDRSFDEAAGRISGELATGSAELRARLQRGRAELEAEVRRQVGAQVPSAVDRQLRLTLSRYGITESTGRQIARVLEGAERAGLI